MGVNQCLVRGIGVIVPNEIRFELEKDEERFLDGLGEWLWEKTSDNDAPYSLLTNLSVGSFYGDKEDWTNIIAIKRLSSKTDIWNLPGGFIKDNLSPNGTLSADSSLTPEEIEQIDAICRELDIEPHIESFVGMLWS